MTKRTKQRIEVLEKRVELLEFQREVGKGKKFIVSYFVDKGGYTGCTVQWEHGGAVHSYDIACGLYTRISERNGYIECYNMRTHYITQVFAPDGDKLESIPVDLYKKAFPTSE